MLLLILLQVVLPIGLIVWLACAPAKNFIGYIVQAVATGLTVLALALVALWMLLPWWLPFAYALLCLLAIAFRAWRHGFNFPSRQPTTLSEWIVLATLIALGSLGAILSWQGIQGRQLPAVARCRHPAAAWSRYVSRRQWRLTGSRQRSYDDTGPDRRTFSRLPRSIVRARPDQNRSTWITCQRTAAARSCRVRYLRRTRLLTVRRRRHRKSQ